MARPSVKEERRKEVLDAFVRCVAQYGLEGATLERLAAESGLKRPLIRHHLGNREAMVVALVGHIDMTFAGLLAAMQGALPDEERVAALLAMLFDQQTVTDTSLILAFAALTAHAERDEHTRKVLCASMVNFEGFLREELTQAYPEQDGRKLAAVAQALMALYFNLDSLSSLKLPGEWRIAARDAADMLIDSLLLPLERGGERGGL